MSLVTYQDTRPWPVRSKAVALRKMPPWFADPNYGHFTKRSFAQKARSTRLVKWADTGRRKANPKAAPAPVQWPRTAGPFSRKSSWSCSPRRAGEGGSGVGADCLPLRSRATRGSPRWRSCRPGISGASHLLQLRKTQTPHRVQPLRMGARTARRYPAIRRPATADLASCRI